MTGRAEVRLAQGVGVMTAASGAALVLAPRLVLRLLGAGRREPGMFFLQVVGMFMTASGGLLIDGTRGDQPSAVALRWAFAQKLGAAVAVSLGVRSGRLGRQAAGIAAIDGLSAVLLAKLVLDDGA